MEEKIREFEIELQNQIDRLENRLKDAENELKKNIDGNLQNILNGGLAKYAENVTNIHAQLDSLYDIQSAYVSIFELNK